MLWIPATAVLVALCALALVYASYLAATRRLWVGAAMAIAAAALIVRGYAAYDFELHPWDERYHALVAKHLIERPLAPTLYSDPALPYDYRDWNRNHVWLHKPPLSLWIQAASMGIFGISEIPLRLPSLLFSTASVMVTFGIGLVLFSPQVGLVAASFHAFNGFLVDLASGRRASDHVDTLLLFLVEIGIFATVIVEKRKPRFAGIVLGVACGLGYLTKSVPALLVLPIWILIRWHYKPLGAIVKDVVVAGLVALVVALPWTLYSMNAFPQEWRYESTYAWRHVAEALEGQGGPPWQYVKDMPRHFGELIYVPLVFALASMFKRTASPARRAMLFWAAVPYVAFSAMATKMPAYVMLAAPALFLIQADFWLTLQQWRTAETRSWRKVPLTVASVVLAVLPARHLLSPTGPLEARERDPQWARDLRDLNQTVGPGKAVIFHIPAAIEAMFYTPYVVYENLPTSGQIESLRNRGYRVYVYEGRSADHPPSIRRVDDDSSATPSTSAKRSSSP
jgi:4-amino-4-deoxy-L-arabinose transferase